MLQPITEVKECRGKADLVFLCLPAKHFTVRETTRDQIELHIRLAPEVIDKFSQQESDQDLRFMIYCAAEPVSSFTASDIAFPQSVEIKVNGNEVKANLRGLKGKLGTTRPADITDLIHRRPNYFNTIIVTYALTSRVRSMRSLPRNCVAKQCAEVLSRGELSQQGETGSSRQRTQSKVSYIQGIRHSREYKSPRSDEIGPH